MFNYLFYAGLAVLICTSCNQTSDTNTSKNLSQDCIGSFAHNVYFWLENPENEDDKELFVTQLNEFIKQSAYVQTAHIGTPVPSERDVVDGSYTYSLVLTFANKEAQDLYQDEPAHKELIKQTRHLWKRIVVYDSEQIPL